MAAINEIQHARRGTVDFDRLLAIARGEYLEMPGLRLTRQQAQRLWALDEETCLTLLRTLEERDVLRRTSTGHYVLAH